MTRGEVFTVQDPQTGQWIDCEVQWSGARTDPPLLGRWPSQSSLMSAAAVVPAKGRKGTTPAPPMPAPRV